MDTQTLLAALEANAERARKPVKVDVDGVGEIYVRMRTVAEFEDMAAVNGAEEAGKFGPAIARLICDENGNRFPAEVQQQLGALLARQPDNVFHAIVSAADGKAKGTEAGN